MTNAPSPYLRHLPELFRQRPAEGGSAFLGEFLKIFEALLTGRSDSPVTGLASLRGRVDGFVEHLEPSLVPLSDPTAQMLGSEFLNYLASWVALVLDQNWDMSKKRFWLSRIVPLYKRRGTRAGLQAYLETFVGNQVSVDEPLGGFLIHHTSTVGDDTFIAGAPAYYFRVRIAYAFGSAPFHIDEWTNVRMGTRAIVDLEKPAHTYYTLEARTPGFVVGQHATIAGDTLIWELSQPFV